MSTSITLPEGMGNGFKNELQKRRGVWTVKPIPLASARYKK